MKNYANEYRLNFESLLYEISNVPGKHDTYLNADGCYKVLLQYINKYQLKTVRKLLKFNEDNWSQKGWKADFSKYYEQIEYYASEDNEHEVLNRLKASIK